MPFQCAGKAVNAAVYATGNNSQQVLYIAIICTFMTAGDNKAVSYQLLTSYVTIFYTCTQSDKAIVKK